VRELLAREVPAARLRLQGGRLIRLVGGAGAGVARRPVRRPQSARVKLRGRRARAGRDAVGARQAGGGAGGAGRRGLPARGWSGVAWRGRRRGRGRGRGRVDAQRGQVGTRKLLQRRPAGDLPARPGASAHPPPVERQAGFGRGTALIISSK